MTNNLSTLTEKRRIEYSDCDKSGFSKLSALASFLQDIAIKHDLYINQSLFNSGEIIHSFALLRSNFKMLANPKWMDEISIKTWLQPLENESRFLYRNFIVYDKDNNEIGYSTITAFYIDLVERKAKAIPDEVKTYPSENRIISTSENSKIRRPKSIAKENLGVVVPADLDMYNHVNNNRYLCWAVDATPINIQENYHCTSVEVQFRMELQNNEAFICKTEINESNESVTATHVVLRQEDNKEMSRLLTVWEKRD